MRSCLSILQYPLFDSLGGLRPAVYAPAVFDFNSPGAVITEPAPSKAFAELHK